MKPAHATPVSARSAARLWVPLLVLVAGGWLSFKGWDRARQGHAREVQAYFDYRSRDALARVEGRLREYEQTLMAARGLMSASEEVTRPEFATFVEGLQLDQHFPGIQGVGFAVWVPAAEKERHEASVRREGFPNYGIHPKGERGAYSPVIYLEPFRDRNLRAFGFDMYSESAPRLAMTRARDAGQTSLSAKVKLIQENAEDVQAGFLIYVPVYRKGPPPQTVEARRQRLLGWVYAPFRMNDFMAGLLGEGAEDLDLHIYDGEGDRREALMFDQDRLAQAGAPGHFAQHSLRFGGHSWTVKAVSTPSLLVRHGGDVSHSGLFLGGLGSLLLAVVASYLLRDWERARARAEAGEDRYRHLMNHARDAILLLDEAGELLELNQQARRMFAFPETGWAGLSLGDLFEVGDPKATQACLDEVRQNGAADFLGRFKGRDGREFSGETSASSLSFGPKKVVLLVIRDATVRLAEAKALADSQTLLAAIINGTTDAIFVKDTQGHYLLLNAAGERIVGKRATEVMGRNDSFLFPLHEAECVMAGDRQVMENRVITTYEDRVSDASGSPRVFLSTKGPLYDEGGHLTGMFGISRDVTERRRAEEALKESDARLRAILDTALDSVVGMDSAGIITEWNSRAEAVFGWTRREAVGENLADLIIPEQQREAHHRGLARYLATGEARILDRRIEITARRRDGQEIPMELAITALGMGDGCRFTAFLSDISERKHAEAERRTLQAQLLHAQKMESLGQLAGGVAHEMNNVLAAILGLATAHLELHSEQSPAHRAFNTIAKASARGAKVVKELLNLSRKGLEEQRDIELNALIQSEVQLLERTTLAQVQLEMELHPGLPVIHGDADAISHVLMNLCLNAVDAMEGHGLLTLRTRRSGHQVEIEVEDTGCGMSQEVLDRAMEPFFTTKPQGKGTGLGLSLVYATVKAHGGVVEIHSTQGAGTRILLRFPISRGTTS